MLNAKSKETPFVHEPIETEHVYEVIGQRIPSFAKGWSFHIADRHREFALKEILKQYHGRLLDHGCGDKKYQNAIAHSGISAWVGMDLPNRTSGAEFKSLTDVDFSGREFPLPSNSFDIVLSTQVLEHVPDLELAISEIARVLKPGGVLIATVPQTSPLHEQPYDFRRFTPYGIALLGAQWGLQLERSIALTGIPGTLGSLIAMHGNPIKLRFVNYWFVNFVLYASLFLERLTFKSNYKPTHLTLDYLFVIKKIR